MQSDIGPAPPRPKTKSSNSQSLDKTPLRRARLLVSKGFSLHQNLPDLEEQAGRSSMISQEGESATPSKHRWHSWSKRKKAALASVSLILVLGGGFGVFSLLKPAPKLQQETLKVVAEPPAEPKTVASPLSGVQVPPELAARPVTAIMIENSLDARPQSGIQEAGVVYEAIAEGGITRFLTLFQETTPQYIGPVRSLRPYYIDFAAPFDAGIAHVGGSADALAQIRSSGKDLDQFFNAGSYWRVSSRRAPHNMYTSFERLDALNQKKGYTSSKFTSWPRKADSPLATPTARAININISGPLYNVHYDYEPTSNSYMRSEGGKPHIATSAEADKNGAQIKPKVVIVLALPYSISGKYSVYGTTGSGSMYIFQDGAVTAGSWHKPDRATQFTFADANGQPIKINAGQTWITLVAGIDRVSSQP